MADTGRLIVIEGADGAGKATQTKLLVARLRAAGETVYTMDFPQYEQNFFGAYLREWLDGVHGNFLAIPPKLASVLYAADRFESAPQIREWLAEGAYVVLDRYVSANMMHQGAKIEDPAVRLEFLTWLHRMEHEVFASPEPDVVFYLNIPATLRQGLLFADGTRASVDTVEHDLDHQLAAEQCAQLLTETHGWQMINCVADGVLRTREDIHEELYHTLVTT